jgi:predicted Zn-dependent protease
MRILIAFLFSICLLTPSLANAQGLSVIRDTEIENNLRSWIDPVLKSANLSQSQIDIALVNDSTVNAFVAGGANIFMFAGLIEKADYVDEVIGVMAHEIGHITGGHLIASRRAMEKASYQSILGTVLGVGAAIFSGDGRAAAAVSAGGASLAQRGFFSHSRAQESSADQAALTFFERAGQSPTGLVTFLQKLEGQELLPASQQSEYLRTHPLTRDRIESMRRGLDRSPYAGNTASSAQTRQFERVKAKLIAFRSPSNVPRFYPDPKASEAAQYANAIMAYRGQLFDQAVMKFDQLIAEYPSDPYYHEMKAQTLRDAGRLDEAAKLYSKSLELLNDNAPQIQIALAHVLVEQGKDLDRAETLLNKSLASERRDSTPYRLLATIEGRRNNETAARYYLAEEAAIQGRRAEASRLLELATKDNALTGNLRVKARDLKTYLDGLPKGDN